MRKWRCVSVWMVPYRLATKGWSTALRMRSSVSTRITCQYIAASVCVFCVEPCDCCS